MGDLTEKRKVSQITHPSPMNFILTGGPCIWKSIASRILAGAWCLAAFVLVQAYTSTLITYIIVPHTQPLIESVYDIANNPDIKILLEKDRGLDLLFSVSKNLIFPQLTAHLEALL